MKSFQCSRCECLYDIDEKCACSVGIDPRPKHREKGDVQLCKENFTPLPDNRVWHERFHWE